MQIHELTQGSPEWHAYRAAHFNASDAPAMMGVSPYKTRSELVREYATGAVKDVDAATQARFDDGHRYEALARPLAEQIIGQDLYPVVGSEGRYSASFDGLTMAEDINWEHKTLNDDLRAVMTPECMGADLPMLYQVQMEQQCMVSGAGRVLFMASKWEGEELVEERHCWYEPNEALRAEIVAGWVQFQKDVDAYVPVEYAQKPEADPIMALPALAIHIQGRVASSNLPVFREKAEAYIASIKTDLQTDEDFANAEATVKFCENAEKSLEQAKAGALAQTADIDELMRTVDHISAQLREKRLSLSRTIKDKKDLIKADILNRAKQAFAKHVAALEAEITPLRLVYQARDFAGAMKNKRTLATLHNAVDTELANGKIAVDAIAQAVRGRLTWYRATVGEYECLFADLQTIIQKPDEDFKLVVNTRIENHQQQEAKKAEQHPAHKMLIDGLQRHREGQAEQAAQVTSIETARPAVAPTTPPSLRLGQIAERLGFSLTAEFLGTLGFAPAGKDRSAVLFHESDFPAICAALIRHVTAVAQAKAA